MLLKLYRYLNRIHSSRRQEREARRNLEAICLAQGLRPSYKTMANVRKDNSPALKAANQVFILLCQDLALFGGEIVAVDGSFFKANASTDSIVTAKKLDDQLAALEQKIDAYQRRLAEQDAQAGLGSLAEDGELANKLARLKERQAEKHALQERLSIPTLSTTFAHRTRKLSCCPGTRLAGTRRPAHRECLQGLAGR